MPTKAAPQIHDTKTTLLVSRLDEGLRVEIMTITPELAAKWLRRNNVNRALRRQHVIKLTKAIQAGLWEDCNGSTIVFSDQHDLMDGQHRLQAVIEAGQPITTLVVFGVQVRKRSTIDTGASRSLGDVLSMHGHTQSNSLGATLAVLHGAEHQGLLTYGRGNSPFVSHDQALAYLQAHPRLQDSLARAVRLPKLFRPSHAATLDYLFGAKDATLRNVWYETLLTGATLAQGQAFLALRERLIRDKTDGIRRHPLAAYVYNIRAWNTARRGETRSMFRWDVSEGIPEIK